MTIQVEKEVVFTCDVCGERLNARAQIGKRNTNQHARLLSRPHLFCPECDKSFSLIGRFKKQYAKEKKEK